MTNRTFLQLALNVVLFLPLGFLAPAIAGVFPVWLWVGATVMQMVIYTSVITLVAGVIRDAMRPRPAS